MDKFYFISAFFEVEEAGNNVCDRELLRCGNWFKTKEEATKALIEIKALVAKYHKNNI